MKLYLVIGANEGAQSEPVERAVWAGSQADAASARKQLGTEGFRRMEIATHEVDVPTGKTGLLEFLNILSNGVSVAAAHAELNAK